MDADETSILKKDIGFLPCAEKKRGSFLLRKSARRKRARLHDLAGGCAATCFGETQSDLEAPCRSGRQKLDRGDGKKGNQRPEGDDAESAGVEKKKVAGSAGRKSSRTLGERGKQKPLRFSRSTQSREGGKKSRPSWRFAVRVKEGSKGGGCGRGKGAGAFVCYC